MGTACTESTVFHTCAVANIAMQPKWQDTKPERIEQTDTCSVHVNVEKYQLQATKMQDRYRALRPHLQVKQRYSTDHSRRGALKVRVWRTVKYHTVYSACAVANIAMQPKRQDTKPERIEQTVTGTVQVNVVKYQLQATKNAYGTLVRYMMSPQHVPVQIRTNTVRLGQPVSQLTLDNHLSTVSW